MESAVIILEGEDTQAVAFGISFLLAFSELCGLWPQISGLLVLRGYFFGALNSCGRTFLVCPLTRFVKCYLFAVPVSLFPWRYSAP